VSVTIGGGGRAVIGRVTIPEDYNEPVNFSSGHSSLNSVGATPMQPPYPEDFHLMPQREQFKWILDWQKTDEGKAMLEQNLMPEYPENIVDMTMEELQAWFKQWQESDKGKAYMNRMQEVHKDRRHYAVKIEPDGTFGVDDVPAGKYQLQIHVYDRPMNSYSGRRSHEIIGSVSHEFEVPDANESPIDESFDLGDLTLKIRKRTRVGDVAPDFEAETFEGKTVHLSDYSGKVVLLHFWNSHNPQSIESLEDIQEVYDAFGKNEGFVIMSIVNSGDIEGAREVVEEHELKWLQVSTSAADRRQMYENYGMQQVSYSYVIGSDGKVLARNPGLGQMMSAVEEALKAD
jgi:peroxiredoxin